MDLPYPRLYFRMAVYIGATLIAFILVSAVILVMIATYELQGYVETRQSALGYDAARVLQEGGRDALENWLENEAEVPADVSVFILSRDSEDILGRTLPIEYANFVRNSVIGVTEEPGSNFRPLRLAPELIGPDGQIYSFLVLPNSFHLWGSLAAYAGVIAVALIVIGSVAWLIAGAFGRPIGELQIAVRQLASGQIDARVPAAISNRRDELGALAADFNTMATQLQSLIDSREQLMQEMSHELRSPLARLQASLALASHRNSFGAKERAQIDAEVQSIDRTIGEMLRFSRLDAPGIIARKLLRIDRLLTELVGTEDVEARAQGCEIKLESDRQLTAMGDPDVLRSGFENILRNAIRFSPEGSTIDITARTHDGKIIVQIADRGPGVSEQYLEKLFEPFFRVNSGANDPSGTGLGLAIAQRVFKVHGGTVDAKLRTGGGLVFTIELPAAALT
jgi:two-component system OmpR family sensor kinase